MSKKNDNYHERRGIGIAPFLLLIIILLGGYTYMITVGHKKEVLNIVENCSPVNTTEEIKLDLNSTLVKDLYRKVETSIREDLAQPEFNDNMKIYLAYRQILERDKYDSNCNLFSNTIMEPFRCVDTPENKPKAFKEETMLQELKKLYGENMQIPLANIQLGSSCLGGYAYIKDRGEFVQGKCDSQSATTFSVDKKLLEAKSTGNKIILKEEVNYHGTDSMDVPESLKNGYYYYTFLLDINYNYILLNKTYESKY